METLDQINSPGNYLSIKKPVYKKFGKIFAWMTGRDPEALPVEYNAAWNSNDYVVGDHSDWFRVLSDDRTLLEFLQTLPFGIKYCTISEDKDEYHEGWAVIRVSFESYETLEYQAVNGFKYTHQIVGLVSYICEHLGIKKLPGNEDLSFMKANDKLFTPEQMVAGKLQEANKDGKKEK